ncbi:hypothetical protein ACHAXR_013131 [Thalassiosira sp. AJA248-18]
MTASQNLFRRHRNRDVEDGPAPPSNGGGDGGNMESSTSENYVGSTSAERQDAGSNNSNNDTASAAAASPPTDDDEQELVVQIPNGHPENSGSPSPFVIPNVAWEPSEQATNLRREAIHREVERVQRANFIHFLVLCLVPTTLLLIVIAAIVSEDGECGGGDNGLTVCEREPRNFVNAFTSRCICDAVKSVVGEDLVGGEGG